MPRARVRGQSGLLRKGLPRGHRGRRIPLIVATAMLRAVCEQVCALLPIDGFLDAPKWRIRGPIFANHQDSDRTHDYWRGFDHVIKSYISVGICYLSHIRCLYHKKLQGSFTRIIICY